MDAPVKSPLESLWGSGVVPNNQSGLQHHRVSQPNERPLFAGYRWPEGKPVFTLRIRKTALPSLSSIPTLGGVELIGPVEGNDIYFGLMLRDAKNLDLFETFCRDLISFVAPCQSDSTAVAAFLARLQGWQKFLERGGEGLSNEAQRGLWGELFFLRQHLWPLVEQEAVDLWHGPFHSSQDFRGDAFAVEVKTLTPTASSAKINSEWQLDDSGLSRLFLFCLRLQEEENGESLPQLIQSLRDRCDEDRRKRLDDLLLEASYFDAHAPDYATHRFSPVNQHLFDVRDGFPRLTYAQLPSGVSNIFYNLDSDSCRSFGCGFDALDCFAPSVVP